MDRTEKRKSEVKSTRRDKPTKAQQLRMDRIREIGCIACRKRGGSTQCEIHHQNLGGKAGQKCLGHDFTIGLCAWHHDGRQTLAIPTRAAHRAALGPCLKYDSREFRAEFGTDSELLAYQNELIAERYP